MSSLTERDRDTARFQIADRFKMTLAAPTHELKPRIWYGRCRRLLVPLLNTGREILWLAAARQGISMTTPSTVKARAIHTVIRNSGYKMFIETGTYLGDTVAAVSGHPNLRVISIELDERLYNMACRRFSRKRNIELHHGDCATILPKVLSTLHQPAVFWLDAHYSSGITAKGTVDDPILLSLTQLLNHSIRTNSIMVDDARCFDGLLGRPHFKDVIDALMRINQQYVVRVHNDIIVAEIPCSQ